MKYNAFISYAHAADGQLTPVLQSALHKLGKPWYKRRALNVFRDKTNLPVTPELWPTIVKALEQSEYFILMASPESATSKWVLPEVDYWLTHRSIDTLLIVHSGGILCWDDDKEDFDPEKTDALHPVLFGKFPHEPFIVDLTAIKSAKDRSLSNTSFRDPVIRLAATLHKLPQNDFIGEEIKQHKRTLRIRNTAITTLLLLLLSTGAFLLRSIQNAKKAQKNQAQTLSTLADIKVEEDPTLSFRLAEAAYKKDPENTEAHIRLMDAANYHLYDVIPGKVLGMSDDHSKMVYIDDKTSELCVLDFNTKDTVRFKGDFSEAKRSFYNGNGGYSMIYTAFFNRNMTRFCLYNADNVEPIRLFDLERNIELVLEGDTKGNYAEFSKSGDKLLIGHWEEELPLRAWDINTGKPIALKGNIENYNAYTFTSDGRYLLAANEDGRVPFKVWDLATRDSLHIPDSYTLGSKFPIYYSHYTVSSDGQKFAILRDNGNEEEVKVYEINNSVQIIFRKTFESIGNINFTEDGKKLIVSDRVYELSTKEEICQLEINEDYFYDEFRIASDGNRLVGFNSEEAGQISFWDLESGAMLKLEGGVGNCNFASFSPTGKRLIGLSDVGDTLIRIWDATSGELITIVNYPYYIAKASFNDNDRKVAFFSIYSHIIKVVDLNTDGTWKLQGNIPGADHLVFTGEDYEIMTIDLAKGLTRIWNIPKNKRTNILEGENQDDNIIFSEDGEIFTLLGKNKERKKTLRVWNIKHNRQIHISGSNLGFDEILLSPDGRKLLVYNDSNDKNSIQFWDLISGKTTVLPESDISFSKLSYNASGNKVLGHYHTSNGVKVYDLNTLDTIPLKNTFGYSDFALSNAGDKLLAYHYNGEKPIAIWDFDTGQELKFTEAVQNFREAQFSPDGTKIIAYRHSSNGYGDTAGEIMLWDFVSKDKVSLENNIYNCSNVYFAPNGHWLLARPYGEVIFQLWDTTTGKNVVLENKFVDLDYFSFSKDGNKFFAHDEDGLLMVWDLTSANPKPILKTNTSPYQIELTPDNKKLIGIAGSVMGEIGIKIWDMETGEAVEFDKVTGSISKECYISDNHLLVEHRNGITNIFDLKTGIIHELKSFNGKHFLGIHYNKEEKRLTTITKDGLARVMYTHPDSIIKEVNSRKGGVWKLDAKTRAKYGLSSGD